MMYFNTKSHKNLMDFVGFPHFGDTHTHQIPISMTTETNNSLVDLKGFFLMFKQNMFMDCKDQQ